MKIKTSILSILIALYTVPAISQTEESWGYDANKSKVYVVAGENNFADVCFENRLTVSAATKSFLFNFQGVSISAWIYFDWDDAPDVLVVIPPVGYTVDVLELSVDENTTGCIKIEEMLLG